MGRYDAQGRANRRWRAKALDRLEVSPRKEEGERIRRAAAAAGMSVQGYILSTLRQRMDADGVPPSVTRAAAIACAASLKRRALCAFLA